MPNQKKQTVPIRWEGWGARVLRAQDGFTREYRWAKQGDVVEVAREDALGVLTVPRAQFACVHEADLAALKNEAAAPAAPTTPSVKAAPAPANEAKAEPSTRQPKTKQA
jgi:hypothetical protein